MPTRRLTPAQVAAGDLSFAIAMFGCGLFDAPPVVTGLVAGAMLAYWSASRDAILRRLHGAAWASQTSIAVAVIIAIEAGAYWLGLGMGGYF
ncbi:MAG: hypothetical protein AB7O98_13835 [Hyphomonadaceae bacterium]